LRAVSHCWGGTAKERRSVLSDHAALLLDFEWLLPLGPDRRRQA
jgi:hypothetical protein